MSHQGRRSHDVVGIGNAIVDVLSHVEDRFLVEHRVDKGAMQLVDLNRAEQLDGLFQSRTEASGGSVANTIAGLAMLGGKGGYIGKVCDDRLGDVFASNLAELGVTYRTPRQPAGTTMATGRSMVMVTPDGERTMNTFLGAAELLTTGDMDERMVADSRWIYLEGYRLDAPEGMAGFRKAIESCRRSGGSVALTLADQYCVSRNLAAFTELINLGVDLLLSNFSELQSMFDPGDPQRALDKAAGRIPLVACTRSEKGAIIASGETRVEVNALPTTVVDSTGAGDMFAAGFLHGMTRGASLQDCGSMGCAAASAVVSQIGPRPQSDLRRLFGDLDLVRDCHPGNSNGNRDAGG